MEIRWAICGLGKISNKFIKAVNLSKNSKVVACASSSTERAKRFAQKYNIDFFGTYEEIAKSNEIDAVYICNDTSNHFSSSLLFLENKIPILCEKPITQDISEAIKLFEFAKKQNTLIMEGMWTIFLPSTEKVLEIIEENKLGNILEIKGTFQIYLKHKKNNRVFDNKRGGGSILDLGVYLISYAHLLLGNPKELLVDGVVRNNVDLKTKFILKYANNVKAYFKTSIINAFRMFIKIKLKNGIIIVPNFTKAKRLIVKNKTKKEKYKFKFKNGFQYEIDHFANLIINNKKESPKRTHRDSMDVMKILSDINEKLGISFKTKNIKN